MRTQTVNFAPDRQTRCVFPNQRSDVPEAISELQLDGLHPVIVLIGGEIDPKHAALTGQAIQSISKIAQELGAVVLCGGTDMGIMAGIGQTRGRDHHSYPLIGVAPEELVSWPGGPKGTKFLWWGSQRWQLEPHHSHFILVPGSNFGDESPWIFETATALSGQHGTVTILLNGGEVSRKDIDLSLEKGRPVVVLSRTGRLADELAAQPVRNEWITVVPANSEPQIVKAVQTALSVSKKKPLPPIVDLGQAASNKEPKTVPRP